MGEEDVEPSEAMKVPYTGINREVLSLQMVSCVPLTHIGVPMLPQLSYFFTCVLQIYKRLHLHYLLN